MSLKARLDKLERSLPDPAGRARDFTPEWEPLKAIYGRPGDEPYDPTVNPFDVDSPAWQAELDAIYNEEESSHELGIAPRQAGSDDGNTRSHES